MPACSDTNLSKVSQAAHIFHERFNAGQFQEIYRDADPQFRASISEADFIAKLDGRRQKHGAIRKSNVNGVEPKGMFHRYFPDYQQTRFSGFYNHCENGGFQEFIIWNVSGTEAKLRFYEINIVAVKQNYPQQ